MQKTIETLAYLFRTRVLAVLERKLQHSPRFKEDSERDILVIDITNMAAQVVINIRTEIRRLLGEFGITARAKKRNTELHVSFLPS